MTSAVASISTSGLWRRPLRLSISWSAVQAMSRRRRLQVALGLLWLIDAALQYQPYMFSRGFVTGTIEPSADGAPYIVAHPTLLAAHLMLHHIAVYNAVFASVQLVIALAIFYRPTLKVGLAISIAWSLGVWWLAEGIGGVTNGASPFAGAPGAVILYAFLAVLLWPRRTESSVPAGRSVAEGGPLGAVVPKLVWALLWLGLAQLLLVGTNRSPSALGDLVTGSEDGEPAWVKALDRFLASGLAHHGTEVSVVVAALCAVIAVGVFLPPAIARPVVALAAVFGAVVWVVENFGGIFTGHGTDVNSGPLLVVLAAAYWPLRSRAGRASPP